MEIFLSKPIVAQLVKISATHKMQFISSTVVPLLYNTRYVQLPLYYYQVFQNYSVMS